jgi:hypothetical protein
MQQILALRREQFNSLILDKWIFQNYTFEWFRLLFRNKVWGYEKGYQGRIQDLVFYVLFVNDSLYLCSVVSLPLYYLLFFNTRLLNTQGQIQGGLAHPARAPPKKKNIRFFYLRVLICRGIKWLLNNNLNVDNIISES